MKSPGKKRLLILFGLVLLSVMVAFVLVHALDSSVVASASTIEKGMTTKQVRQIMGEPKLIRKSPEGVDYVEWWEYEGLRRFRFGISWNPFQVRLWEQNRIRIYLA